MESRTDPVRPVSDAEDADDGAAAARGVARLLRGDPDGVNGSWEKARTGVSVAICVRIALAAGEHIVM